ncbi:MAG: hypothetical protein WBE68_27680 [Candidatus Nitrosopolaris sp.]
MKSILASDSLSNREQTTRKVKTGSRLQRYSMYQYIVIELIEGIFGAKETKHHQLYCRFRSRNNQKRFGLIKSICCNLEVPNRLQRANNL